MPVSQTDVVEEVFSGGVLEIRKPWPESGIWEQPSAKPRLFRVAGRHYYLAIEQNVFKVWLYERQPGIQRHQD